jgi:hypothetical protein
MPAGNRGRQCWWDLGIRHPEIAWTGLCRVDYAASGSSPQHAPLARGAPATIIFARIRVLTPEGLANLNLSREAAEELAEALQTELAGHPP